MNIPKWVTKGIRYLLTWIYPEWNTRVMFRVNFGRKLDLRNPKTMNEKILWLKFHSYRNNPLIKQCSDKYKVRDYVKSIGCGEILIDLLAIVDDPVKIEWGELPQQYVLKMNSGCGMNKVVTDKSLLDTVQMTKILKHWMRNKYYLEYAEMQYKGVKPYVLIETFLGKNDQLPLDYKFYCFNGKPMVVMVCTERVIGSSEGGYGAKYFFFDEQWNLLPYSHEYYEYPGIEISKPDGIDQAFEYARKLCQPFPFVRVDLYIVEGRVYFGELTFTPAGGLDTDLLTSSDELFGTFLDIREEMNKKSGKR